MYLSVLGAGGSPVRPLLVLFVLLVRCASGGSGGAEGGDETTRVHADPDTDDNGDDKAGPRELVDELAILLRVNSLDEHFDDWRETSPGTAQSPR